MEHVRGEGRSAACSDAREFFADAVQPVWGWSRAPDLLRDSNVAARRLALTAAGFAFGE